MPIASQAELEKRVSQWVNTPLLAGVNVSVGETVNFAREMNVNREEYRFWRYSGPLDEKTSDI